MYSVDLNLITQLFCSCFLIAFPIALIFVLVEKFMNVFINFVKGGRVKL